MSLRELCCSVESMCGSVDNESFDGRRRSMKMGSGGNYQAGMQQEGSSEETMTLTERAAEAKTMLKEYAHLQKMAVAAAASAAESAAIEVKEAQEQALSSPGGTVTKEELAKQKRESILKIREAKADVRDMQDEILATHRAQNATALSLTSTLEEVERQKSLVVDAHELLRARTEMFLPLIFSVRHVVGQYREVRGSEPTVHDILKNIREGLAWSTREDDGEGGGRDDDGGRSGGHLRDTLLAAESANSAGSGSAASVVAGVLPTEEEIDNLCSGLSELLKMKEGGEKGGERRRTDGNDAGSDTYKVASQMLLQAKLQRQSASLREENLHDEIERLEQMNQQLREQLDDMKDQLAVMNLNHKVLQAAGGIGGGSGIMSPPPHRVHAKWATNGERNDRDESLSLEEEMKLLRDRCEEALESIDLASLSSNEESGVEEVVVVEEEEESNDSEDSEEESGDSEEEEEEEEEERVLSTPAMLSSERFLR